MRSRILTSLTVLASLFIGNAAFAQNDPVVQNTNNNGIYVVMAVCITILTGLIIYLISIDRKIGKIEKQD